jgi:predicted PurR-regulated permease PerM
MPLGAILQPILGTVFIYLILALLVSEIQEQISAITQYRARNLKKSIQILLRENDNDKNIFDFLENLIKKAPTEISKEKQKVFCKVLKYIVSLLRFNRSDKIDKKLLTRQLYENYHIAS